MAVWSISLPLVCQPCVDICMRIFVLCLKLEEKQLVERSLCIEKMLIICSSQMKDSKVGLGFCDQCCFMAV